MRPYITQPLLALSIPFFSLSFTLAVSVFVTISGAKGLVTEIAHLRGLRQAGSK